MSGGEAQHDRVSIVRQVLRFLRLSKTRSENDVKCSRIIEKNKNVERFKDEYPIAKADYTQHRWRSSLRHSRKSSREEHIAPAASETEAPAWCGCQIVKAFTRAKEIGDEATMTQIKDGTFVPTEPCEHVGTPAKNTASTSQHSKEANNKLSQKIKRKLSKNDFKKIEAHEISETDPEQMTSSTAPAAASDQGQFKRRSSLRQSIKKRLNRLKRSATEQVLRQEYSALVVESDTDLDPADLT